MYRVPPFILFCLFVVVYVYRIIPCSYVFVLLCKCVYDAVLLCYYCRSYAVVAIAHGTPTLCHCFACTFVPYAGVGAVLCRGSDLLL